MTSDLIREVLRILHIALHPQPSVRTAHHPDIISSEDAAAVARAIRRIQQGATDADHVEDYLATHTFPMSISTKMCMDEINALRAEHGLEPTSF